MEISVLQVAHHGNTKHRFHGVVALDPELRLDTSSWYQNKHNAAIELVSSTS